MKHWPAILSSLFLALLIPTTVVAQDSADDLASQFSDVINVKVINVQVWVTDKDGNPVEGLTIDDFEMLEDKRPVALTNFYEVKDRVRTNELSPLEPLPEPRQQLESHPELTRRAPTIPDDQRLFLVVYIDHQNIRPHNRNRLFRFLRSFLHRNVTREDRIMLVSYNRSVKIEREFTGDPAMVANALFDLEEHTGGRTSWDSDRRDLIRRIIDEYDPMRITGQIRLHSQSIYNDLKFTIDGLEETVEALAGLPGRKALMYISDGLPMRAGADMWLAAEEKFRNDEQSIQLRDISSTFLESMQYDSSQAFIDLTDLANANDVTFYTVDASGLLGIDSRGADWEGGPFNSNIDSMAIDNMQQSVMFMAEETGGQYIVNTNNFAKAFAKMATDFSHFYSLGFQPSHAGTGRRYNIKVQLKDRELRKKYRLRHRESYRDKSVDSEIRESTLASLKFGFQTNDIGAKMIRRDLLRRDDGLFTVHFDVQVPIGTLTLLPVGEQQDRHLARLKLWVQALASNGDVSPSQPQDCVFEIPESDLEIARTKHYVCQLPLLMKGGDQRISVAIRDENAARTSYVTRSVRIQG